jgi:glycosyltransferase involved in cell wall biosynthesis
MQPELSLIFCSRSAHLPDSLVANINATVGCDVELIVIDNSRNEHSIYEAYQRGFSLSVGRYLAFLHDDIYFHTPDWGVLLKEHLSVPGVGITGIGGRDTLVRVPSSWTVSLPYIHLIQSDKNGKQRKIKHRPYGFNGERAKVVMLDGMMLCMNRTLMEHIQFDTSIKGFHGYDFDICISAAAAGYQNYVMYNIDIEHFSRGNADKTYYRNLIKVFKNHSGDLPLSVINLSPTEQSVLENQGLSRLQRKMMVKGFSFDEIMATTEYFNDIIGKTKTISQSSKCLLLLQYQLIAVFVQLNFFQTKRT